MDGQLVFVGGQMLIGFIHFVLNHVLVLVMLEPTLIVVNVLHVQQGHIVQVTFHCLNIVLLVPMQQLANQYVVHAVQVYIKIA